MRLETLAIVGFTSFTAGAAAAASPVAAAAGLLGLAIISIKNTCVQTSPRTFGSYHFDHCKTVTDYSIWGSGFELQDIKSGKVLVRQWDKTWSSCQSYDLNIYTKGFILVRALTGYTFRSVLTPENLLQFHPKRAGTVDVHITHSLFGAKGTIEQNE